MRCLFLALAILFFFLAATSPSAEQNIDGCVIAVNSFTGAKVLLVDDKGYCNEKFPLGSAIKPFTVLSAFESGFDPSLVVRCYPSSPNKPVRISCWYRPGHGLVDLEKAIAFSCDRYFMELEKLINWHVFVKVLADFSIISNKDTLALKAMDRQAWLESMVGLNPAIKVSPFNLLLAYCALFNGGYLFEIGTTGMPKLKRKIAVNRKAQEVLTKGMKSATEYGTAIEIGKAYPFLRILSKTGTGVFSYDNIIDRSRTHGWYIGLVNFPRQFAETPAIALLAFSFNGTGATDAVPLALKFFPQVTRNVVH